MHLAHLVIPVVDDKCGAANAIHEDAVVPHCHPSLHKLLVQTPVLPKVFPTLLVHSDLHEHVSRRRKVVGGHFRSHDPAPDDVRALTANGACDEQADVKGDGARERGERAHGAHRRGARHPSRQGHIRCTPLVPTTARREFKFAEARKMGRVERAPFERKMQLFRLDLRRVEQRISGCTVMRSVERGAYDDLG